MKKNKPPEIHEALESAEEILEIRKDVLKSMLNVVKTRCQILNVLAEKFDNKARKFDQRFYTDELSICELLKFEQELFDALSETSNLIVQVYPQMKWSQEFISEADQVATHIKEKFFDYK
jgi:hypothetical protein